MLICDEKKFIFFHMRKTGGKTAIDLLKKSLEREEIGYSIKNPKGTPAGKHLAPVFLSKVQSPPPSSSKWALEMNESVYQKYKDYYKVVFVRNPYDKLVSFYFEKNNHVRALAKNQKLTFEEWVRICCCEDKKELKKVSRSPRVVERARKVSRGQYDYIFVDGKEQVDYIARFENWKEEFQFICDKFNLVNHYVDDRSKWINTSDHLHYSKYYNSGLKKLVEVTYQKDLETFGYDFERK